MCYGHLPRNPPGYNTWLGEADLSLVAPDIFSEEPIVAWRSWLAVPPDTLITGNLPDDLDTDVSILLRSCTYPVGWPSRRRMEAICKNRSGGTWIAQANPQYDKEHQSPYPLHDCGIYGLKAMIETEHWNRYNPTGPQIIGQVSLWGKILAFEKGYRAEYAYPYSLYITDWTGEDKFTQEPRKDYGKDFAFEPEDVVKELQRVYGVDTFLGLPEEIRQYRKEHSV